MGTKATTDRNKIAYWCDRFPIGTHVRCACTNEPFDVFGYRKEAGGAVLVDVVIPGTLDKALIADASYHGNNLVIDRDAEQKDTWTREIDAENAALDADPAYADWLEKEHEREGDAWRDEYGLTESEQIALDSRGES